VWLPVQVLVLLPVVWGMVVMALVMELVVFVVQVPVPVVCVVQGGGVWLVIVLVMCGVLVECVWLLEDLGPVLVVNVILMMVLVLLPVVCLVLV
jgi:hypothetical protein